MNTNFGRRLGTVIGLAALPIVVILAGCSSSDDGSSPTVEEAQTGPVKAALSAEKLSVGGKEGVNVQVTLTNDSAETVRLLKWETIADGLKEPLFVLTHDGQAVEYQGRHYKHVEPTESDYLTLGPGEVFTGSVDLAEYYDMSASGTYDVQYRHEDIASNHVTLRAESHISPQAARDALNGAGLHTQAAELAGSISFRNCSASRQTDTSNGFSSAKGYANNAVSYLDALSAGKPRYTTWLGTYSSTRRNTVTSHFKNIQSSFENKNFTFDCGCEDSAYAYVYPSQPYIIYLCRAFWPAPEKGTDSKAGTIIHETSHFNVVAGTDDHAYGQSACKDLAQSSPTRAIDNADSHEYFAENTPFQN